MTICKYLHCPPELILNGSSPQPITKAVERWRKLSSPEPRIRMTKHKVSGYGPEHALHTRTYGSRLQLPSVDTPHGLLFRTEDNVSFLAKIFMRFSELSQDKGIVPVNPKSRSLHYSSVMNEGNKRLWTPTVPQLVYSLVNYGGHWTSHYQSSMTDYSALDRLGLGVESPRILLLAIDYKDNRLFKGMDPDELVIRDSINVKRIFIVNDSPDLFHRLLELELKFWSLPKTAKDKVIENFERLNKK